MEKQREATLDDTLNFCVESWLERIKTKKAKGTIDRYKSVYECKIRDDVGERTLHELTAPAYLFDYAAALVADREQPIASRAFE